MDANAASKIGGAGDGAGDWKELGIRRRGASCGSRVRRWIGILAFLSFLGEQRPAGDSTEKLDLAVMNAMQTSGYIKALGAVRDEVNKPLEEWTAMLDPSSLSDEQVALYRFSLPHNLKALKFQIEIDQN